MDFKNYYLQQTKPSFPVFRGASFQRGYGFGSVFSRFFKWFAPIFKENATPILKSIGKEAFKGAINVANQTINEGGDFKSIAKNQLKKSISNVVDQVGSGKKVVFKKRKITNLDSFSKNIKKKTKRKRRLDIFD